MADNPHIGAEYADTLKNLPAAQYKRLAEGDFDVPDDGDLFRAEWFQKSNPTVPRRRVHRRPWRTLPPPNPQTKTVTPTPPVGILLYHHHASKTYYIADIVRARLGPGAGRFFETLVVETAKRAASPSRSTSSKSPAPPASTPPTASPANSS